MTSKAVADQETAELQISSSQIAQQRIGDLGLLADSFQDDHHHDHDHEHHHHEHDEGYWKKRVEWKEGWKKTWVEFSN